jgi:thioredoxin-like negative regulator of GroEL
MREITEYNIQEILNFKSVIVEFWSEHSDQCKSISSIFKDISENCFSWSDISFARCNIDTEENSDFIKKAKVKNVPCFVLFVDGLPKEKIEGIFDKEDLKNSIEDMIPS